MLKWAFQAVPGAEVAALSRAAPISAFRRAWYLHGALTGDTLAIDDVHPAETIYLR
jgi:hypothetical protein